MHQRNGVLGPCALYRMEAQGRRCEGAVAQKRKALAEAIDQQHSVTQILYYAEKQEAGVHRYHAKRLKALQTLTEVELRVAACLSLITDHIRDDIARDYCEFVWSAKDRSSAPSTALNWAETHSIIDAEVSNMKACRPVRQGDPDWPHHFAAAKWLAEKLVFEWLVQCNFKGVAPSTTQVVEQYIVCWPEASLGQVAEKHFADRCSALDVKSGGHVPLERDGFSLTGSFQRSPRRTRTSSVRRPEARELVAHFAFSELRMRSQK